MLLFYFNYIEFVVRKAPNILIWQTSRGPGAEANDCGNKRLCIRFLYLSEIFILYFHFDAQVVRQSAALNLASQCLQNLAQSDL